ncbi:hypothetical protein [Pseudoduganella umbonata]|uniref:Uncharacterized protein n=1 Tax=Pseudoduganella umbonata TaxID=864828 RepID=A0A4P8HJY5_9BURK|nr:hypothetical protein [Pseudoduganella umbonata]MBB3219901.1 hypothetical protein [Pseudoduganella umbonata]QCP09923.1 hypothetical protein FCL38_05420 [Pseudoduganella umbonata]
MESIEPTNIKSTASAEEQDSHALNESKIVGPYVVATASGFLVSQNSEASRCKVYTDPNVRHASTWVTFDEADQAAKRGVASLYPKELHYYSILVAPNIKQVDGC